MPVSFRDRVGGLIPSGPGWGWAWRVEQRLFGKRKPVNISTRIFQVSGPLDLLFRTVLPAEPSFSSSVGSQVWLIAKDQSEALRRCTSQELSLNIIAAPRFATADGVGASMAIGSPPPGSTNGFVGARIDVLGIRRKNATDLIYSCTVTELNTNTTSPESAGGLTTPLITTNLHVGFRVQIPSGCGLFLLQQPNESSSGRPMGVLIDPL